MERIGVIAPDLKVYDGMLAAAADLGLSERVEVCNATLDMALPIARRMENQGVHVIISRGNTVDLLLHSGITAPLINIPSTIYDLSTLIARAREMTGLAKPRIAFISYPCFNFDITAFACVLDIDMRVYLASLTRQSIREAVDKAVAAKPDVLVGGETTRRCLTEDKPLFLPYVSGETSLKQALLEGWRIATACDQEQRRTCAFRAAVNSLSEGIITLDHEDRITMFNRTAKTLLALPEMREGAKLLDIWPASELRQCLISRRNCSDEIILHGGQWLLVNIVFASGQEYAFGAAITLQKTDRIKRAETRLRSKFASKGFMARHTFSSLVVSSKRMEEVVRQSVIYAGSAAPILISGETGTGKDVFAQAIHNASPRRQGPFVAVNCAALPPSLLESEIFGYEEGAFTGAIRKGKPGLFEMAHGGTIFLDEISAMDHYGQTRLLRVLQEPFVFRLGGDRYIPTDFRIIAASNVDLWSKVLERAFREDLFFRLNGLPIFIPPLREWKDDIGPLARRFAAQHRIGDAIAFSPEALLFLENLPWRGNVRELQHCVHRLCLLHGGGAVTEKDIRRILDHGGTAFSKIENSCPVADFPRERFGGVTPEPAGHLSTAGQKPISPQSERERILDALRASGGNQRKAAALLDMHKSTIYRKMRRYGITKVAR
ncbi:MAG: sigma 54-interacting transcriptional regulator [Desulfovibrio sp.]|jgi:transcriptional regulator with PAS, ATPase and Fis domain|nr:sigma 54-interacting transcriptional regulator [Desulfovibrio sp.]